MTPNPYESPQQLNSALPRSAPDRIFGIIILLTFFAILTMRVGRVVVGFYFFLARFGAPFVG